MEELLKNVLHLGVGVSETIQDGFQINSSDPQGILFELISKGKSVDDGTVNQLRGYIEEISNSTAEYQVKAREIFESLVTAVQNLDTNNIVEDINTKVAEIMSKITDSGSTDGTQD